MKPHSRRVKRASYTPPRVHDSSPLSEDSHGVELVTGFTVLSKLSIEKTGGLWYVHSVRTPEAHRGRGHARQLLAHVEDTYGPFVVISENDDFWSKQGFAPREDGYWARTPRLRIREKT